MFSRKPRSTVFTQKVDTHPVISGNKLCNTFNCMNNLEFPPSVSLQRISPLHRHKDDLDSLSVNLQHSLRIAFKRMSHPSSLHNIFTIVTEHSDIFKVQKKPNCMIYLRSNFKLCCCQPKSKISSFDPQIMNKSMK